MLTSFVPKPYVLVIDDQEDILEVINHILTDEGFDVQCVADNRNIVSTLRTRQPDLVLLDVWLNDSRFDGVAVFDIVKQYYRDVPVIMISGHSSISTAVSALKDGVFDFLPKPFSTEQLMAAVNRAIAMRRLKREYDVLQENAEWNMRLDKVVRAWEAPMRSIAKLSEGRSRVLIRGEVGVGKTYAARLLHMQSAFKDGPFVVFKCNQMTDADEIMRMLVGVEDKSSQKVRLQIGFLERAARGTFVFDNIDSLPKKAQEFLCDILREGRFLRQNGEDFVPLEARFVSTTVSDLSKKIGRNEFLEDLYHRISVVEVVLPSVRSTSSDITKLLTHFIRKFSHRQDLEVIFDRASGFQLESYDWPGNMREVRNLADWFVMMLPVQGDKMVITEAALVMRLGKSVRSERGTQAEDPDFDIAKALSMTMRQAREYFEKYYLEFHLKRHNRNFSRTAEVVGMERTALHRKIRQYQG